MTRAVVLDWDYDKSSTARIWKLHKDQRPSVEIWDADRINAMRVAELLGKK